MLIIEYKPFDSQATLIEDGRVENFALAAYNDSIGSVETTIKVGNELICLAFRTLANEGKIPFDQIQFKYEDRILKIDKNGRMSEYFPVCIVEDLLMRL